MSASTGPLTDHPASLLRDISRALKPGHPTWPGDPAYHLHARARMAGGDSVNTAELQTGTHTGTHVDAPWHYCDTAPFLDAVPLARYVGRCRVLTVKGVGSPSLVPPSALDGLPNLLPPRLLLHTGQAAEWITFPEDFTALDPAFVAAAAARGVRLIGTDSPSVDPLTSKTMKAHAACLAADVLILEGLNLSSVPDGEYDLMCLPLPLASSADMGVDGAPARAVLLPAGTLAAVEET